MKNIKTFENFGDWQRFKSDTADYTEYIIKIINFLDETNIQYEDLYKSNKHLYFVTKLPLSFSFIGNDVVILKEEDGITETVVTYDINTEMNKIFDVIKSFSS